MSRPSATAIWAKSPPGPGQPGESLLQHTRQAVKRLTAWRKRLLHLPALIPRPDLWDLAAWSLALHDLGKIVEGFQHMLRGKGNFYHRHEVLSLVAAGWLKLDNELLGLLAAGVATHHKDIGIIKEMYPFEGDARPELLAQLLFGEEKQLQAWMSKDLNDILDQHNFRPLPAINWMDRHEAFARAMLSLRQIDQKLQSQPATSSLALTVRSLRGLVVLCDHAGSALQPVNLSASLDRVAAYMHSLEQSGCRPWPHQAACAKVQGNVLLSAPTGSGKTECALLWAQAQIESGESQPVVFYVLPFKASLNAMRARLQDKYHLPDESVVLQHSSATAALYTFFANQTGASAKQAALAANQERRLGRLMTAPLRLITPYQLLRAFFGLRGHEAVLTDAAGGLFVLDELHAFEHSRLALILCAFRHLTTRLGARYFVMSATMPSILAKAVQDFLGGCTVIQADATTQKHFSRHVLRLYDADLLDETTLQAITERHQARQAVLVVATTVARAQAVFEKLKSRTDPGQVWLLHSRFTAHDRSEKENRLMQSIGTQTRKPTSNTQILVATQVVEVSLDVDFDVLFTDPAPIESLAQRFGRINRSLRSEPKDVIVMTKRPNESDHVYPVIQLEKAIQILRPFMDQTIDETALQGWVDQSYQGFEKEWQARLRQEIERIEKTVVEVNRPLQAHEELKETFESLFDGTEVVPACLQESYEELMQTDPLRATMLRIPISYSQAGMLRRKGLLKGEIVTLPYDKHTGLDLQKCR